MGDGATVTTTGSDFTQPKEVVPVTIYVVVDAGVATGLAHVLQLNPAIGFHVYVAAPVATNVVCPPGQIV